jgi:hypothetical protein
VICSNAPRSLGSWEKKQAVRTARIALACACFRLSRLPVSCIMSLTRCKSSLSLCISYRLFQHQRSKRTNSATNLKLHPSLLLTHDPPARTRRPWFQMQPLQQRCAPPCFPLQAPVPAQHMQESVLLPQHHLPNVFQDPVHYDMGDERRARLVSFSIGTRGFGKFGIGVA